MRIALLLLFAGSVFGDDLRITEDGQWGKRTLVLDNGPIQILGDGITIDFGEALIRSKIADGPPDEFEGIGLLVDGRKNVKIVGGRWRGFRCAILVRNCENVTIDGADVSGNFRQRLRSTPENEDLADWLRPHNNDQQEWRKRYGAGICIERSKGCIVRECVGRSQQNGLILDRATNCRVLDNDFSFNSGWGIALWRSTDNLLSQNKCDWCVRGYSHGVYARGQDSAGILLFEQSSRNIVWRNSATHSGDGFFLYAGDETLKRTGLGGSNDNLVAYNDFSHAVANSIEATFSTRNRFIGNLCEDSNYGIWAGYSYSCLFEGNSLSGNRIAGIAIEHGRDHRIVLNTFQNNARGIQLWWDDDKDLLATVFGQKHDCLSQSYLIASNFFDGDKIAYEFRDSTKISILGDHLDDVGRGIVKIGNKNEVTVGDAVPEDLHGTKIEEQFPKHRDVFLPGDHPRGMSEIRMSEWGPMEPSKASLWPAIAYGWGSVKVRASSWGDVVFVQCESPNVTSTIASEGFWLRTEMDGLIPYRGVATVQRRNERALGSLVATALLRKELKFAGVLIGATWDVRHWQTTADPRKSWAVPDDALRVRTRRPQFMWGDKGPGGWKDNFATHARTKINLPAGRYQLRTASDDGVRLILDGKTVIEDWTHHAPRVHTFEVELKKGVHMFVLEHFELDGWAELRFDLRPLP